MAPDIALVILGSLLILVGVVGCIIPGLPGPPLAYVSLIVLQFTKFANFTITFLVLWGLLAAAITVFDYVIPIYGTKKFGGSKAGVRGSLLGLIVGIFVFPPIGMIIGPFLGAVVGELMQGKTTNKALTAGLGAFIGFVAGTAAKLVYVFVIAFYFVRQIV